jgi:O-antigen ligase
MHRGVLERVCLAIFFAWLATVALPFGSVIEQARLPLVTVPLVLGAVAALIRLEATRDRTHTAQPTRAWMIFGLGGLFFILAILLQLVPLPPSMLRAISPESHAIWSRAEAVRSLVRADSAAFHPITVDPDATLFEIIRITALLATFSVTALLVRSHVRRMTLAFVLCAAALFQVFYGVREAALGRYAIWGWVNTLIFDRVTGTFVNPNHYGHYLAIVTPLAMFVGAIAWRESGARHVPLKERFAQILQKRPFLAAFSVFATIALLVGVLVSQSRGALLSLAAGMLGIAAFLPGRRVARVSFAAAAGLVLVASLVLFLGPQRTVGRFMPTELERQTLVGRRIGISAAVGLWQRFPILGSGVGTFPRVVFMEHREDIERTYHHAHNDYAEIAATAGTLGAVIAFVALIGGCAALQRQTFGESARELSWRRRAYQAAALASILIACVHALFDFNFFIPANPATLASIAGAAVATVDHDKRTRL